MPATQHFTSPKIDDILCRCLQAAVDILVNRASTLRIQRIKVRRRSAIHDNIYVGNTRLSLRTSVCLVVCEAINNNFIGV